MKNNIFELHLKNHQSAIEAVRSLQQSISSLAKKIADVLKNGNSLYICGNGGSASDAMHIAGELIGRYKSNRPALSVVCLNADAAVLTCISNDFGYDQVFARQLSGLAKPGDIALGISTSGNSKNVFHFLEQAKLMNLESAAFLGKGGGSIKEVADYPIIVQSSVTASIQEAHITLGHIMCSMIENIVFGISDNE